MNSPSLPQMMDYRHARRVLMFLSWGIGDTMMQRPLLAALRSAAPAAQIVAMGSQTAIELLEDRRLADEVVSYESFGIQHYGQQESPATDESLRSWLHDRGPWDFILNCRHAPRPVRHALWWGGIQTIEGDESREREALAAGAGCQEAWLEAAATGWHIPINTGAALRLDPPSRARLAAEEALEVIGLGDAIPAAISPIASLGLKRWPVERFAELGDRLIEATRSPLLIFAGDQPDAARDVRQRMTDRKRAYIMDRCHLLDTAALLQRCRVLVCNDTGLLHIAASVGTPVLGIHGPTSPQLYRPRFPWALAIGGQTPECVHRPTDHLDLAGCWQGDTCLISDESCINTVSVDDAWNAVGKLIPLSTSPRSALPARHTAGTPQRRAGQEEAQSEPFEPG